MSQTTPALKLSNIELHYGYVRALDGVDFHVQPGEIVGLLGDNGAGKSTLLKVMSGAHRPTHGTIEVNGQATAFHTPKDAAAVGIQMVYQDLALVEAQDIATNLQLGREPLRGFPFNIIGFVDHKAMQRTSAEQLSRLGVRTAPMNRPVEMLSGGQRQVVAISRAAVRVMESGGVILLDEPTAALGYEQTQLVEELIVKMAQQGIAIVLVTHNLPLCYNLAHRIVVLNRGRKVADIAKTETDMDSVVGWITGAKKAM
ncbi:MAG: sugar ABC transporter ATP-binding protein [Ardenticatenaceae bacterium]|nr:sugar ABC transporter ATP-binding protein [Ardenticatenaceae bacterium]